MSLSKALLPTSNTRQATTNIDQDCTAFCVPLSYAQISLPLLGLEKDFLRSSLFISILTSQAVRCLVLLDCITALHYRRQVVNICNVPGCTLKSITSSTYSRPNSPLSEQKSISQFSNKDGATYTIILIAKDEVLFNFTTNVSVAISQHRYLQEES